jgi:EmrB/QacA subfamily drug resistance transporter
LTTNYFVAKKTLPFLLEVNMMKTQAQTYHENSPGNTNRWKAFVFIGISLLVISLDNTILNVALPSISRDLGASASELQWIVDAYILVFAALLLTMGALGDRIGRKRILQIGLAWFGLGSVAAALSPTIEFLIGARAFLGLGGAMIMPATLSIITATFLDPEERSKAIGLWAAVYGLGVGLGPLIGGGLLVYFDWSAAFYINLPVVAAALLGGQVFIGESKDDRARPLDIPGVVLSVAGLFALVYAIIEVGVSGWTGQNVLPAFGVAVALLVVFLWWEGRAVNAMLPLKFFRNLSFSAANLALVMMMFANYGVVFFLTQYFQSVQGYTPLQAGLAIFPMALLVTVGAVLSARLAGRFGIKVTVGAGMLLAAAGLVYMALVAEVGTPYLVLLPLALFPLGLGAAMPAATDSVMGAVPVNRAGIGSAMNDAIRLLGGALGVAVLGTIMNGLYLDKIAGLTRALPLPTEVLNAVSSSIQGAHLVARQVDGAAAQTIVETANQAFLAGMNVATFVGAVILGLSALLTLLILPAAIRRPGEDKATPPAPTSLSPVAETAD